MAQGSDIHDRHVSEIWKDVKIVSNGSTVVLLAYKVPEKCRSTLSEWSEKAKEKLTIGCLFGKNVLIL